MYALVGNNGAFEFHTVRSRFVADKPICPICMYADLRSRMRERGGGGADAGADPLLVATL
jgi:hypothetical protein